MFQFSGQKPQSFVVEFFIGEPLDPRIGRGPVRADLRQRIAGRAHDPFVAFCAHNVRQWFRENRVS